jgi:hypothetical membrane protein
VYTPHTGPAIPQPTPLPSAQGTPRPTGVAVLSIVMFLGGAADIGMAALLLFLGAVTIPMLAFLPNIQLVGTLLLVLAVFPLILAVFSFVLGFGLWTGRSWAWLWTLISSIIGLIVSVVASVFIVPLMGVVIYAIFIFYLTRGNVKYYFGRSIAPSEIRPIAAAPISEYEQVTQPGTISEAREMKPSAIVGQNRNRKIAGTLFLVAWIQSIYLTSIAEGLYPNFSLQQNLVSDLGVQPQSAVVWTASLIVLGVLVIVAGLALSDFLKSHRELLVTFVLMAVGVLGVGAFNENAFYYVHLAFAFLAVTFGAISALLVSLRFVKGLFRYFSLILGVVMLIGIVLLLAGFFVAPIASVVLALGRGVAETIVVVPELVWFIMFGGYLLGTSVTPSEDSSPNSLYE